MIWYCAGETNKALRVWHYPYTPDHGSWWACKEPERPPDNLMCVAARCVKCQIKMRVHITTGLVDNVDEIMETLDYWAVVLNFMDEVRGIASKSG